jgi:hypothetical protein
MYFSYRTFDSDVSEIPISFPFPKLPFPISFSIKNMKTVTVLVFSDRFRPFSPLVLTFPVSPFSQSRLATDAGAAAADKAGTCAQRTPSSRWAIVLTNRCSGGRSLRGLGGMSRLRRLLAVLVGRP